MSTTRCSPAAGVRDRCGRSRTGASSPTCSSPARRSAAGYRWPASRVARRSWTPFRRAASAGRSGATRSRARRRSPSSTRSKASVPGRRRSVHACASGSRRWRPTAGRCVAAGRWSRSNCPSAAARKRVASRVRHVSRGCCCSLAGSTETSSASSSRSRSATKNWTRGSTSWRASSVAADVAVEGCRKTYGDVVAVDNVDLTVGAGEFFTLLGPSGSGKTTTLRMIAGFEQPDAGRITLGGEDITRQPPYARDVNTVFQDYALFPHMTVAENVGYGLRVRRVPRRERARRVDEVLERVRLAGYGKRKPIQLSGGQRQRIALARSIVNRPQVLLLDEPLGALDLKLRQEMQEFLKTLQRELRMTFLYVTHDQEEALTMSDRVAVFNDGRIEQVGTPAEVYDRPETEFVAGFVGTSNILERGGRRVGIRPERIVLNGTGEPATVAEATFVGSFVRYAVETDAGERLTVVRQSD